jgi:hypothetical protein
MGFAVAQGSPKRLITTMATTAPSVKSHLLYRLSCLALIQGIARFPLGTISQAVEMCDVLSRLLGRFLPRLQAPANRWGLFLSRVS